ncbi:MAG: nucleotidyltransferase domain-containing protein [Nitrospirota bacterium]
MSVRERWAKTKPIRYSTDESITLILSVLKTDSRILIGYLFGSRVKGKETLSDIDIAIYTSGDFSWQDYYILYGEITKRLRSDRVDLAWLNKTEPLLSFTIIKNGRVLFFRDPDTLNEVELRIKKRYYDFVIYLNKHRRYRELGL